MARIIQEIVERLMESVFGTLYGEYFLPLTKRLQALRATLNATELMKRQGSNDREE